VGGVEKFGAHERLWRGRNPKAKQLKPGSTWMQRLCGLAEEKQRQKQILPLPTPTSQKRSSGTPVSRKDDN